MQSHSHWTKAAFWGVFSPLACFFKTFLQLHAAFWQKPRLIYKTLLMKKLLFYLLLAILPSGIFCQPEPQAAPKHELGMNLYALTIRPGDFYSQYKNRIDNYLLNGLYYKLYFGRSALRCSFNYLRRFNNASVRYGGNVYSSRTFQAAMGYQYALNKGSKTVPYVFADASFSLLNELRSRDGYYALPYHMSSSIAYYPNYYTSCYQGAVSPGIGLRLHLGKNVMLTLETALQLFYEVEGHSYRSIGVSARPFQCQLGFMF